MPRYATRKSSTRPVTRSGRSRIITYLPEFGRNPPHALVVFGNLRICCVVDELVPATEVGDSGGTSDLLWKRKPKATTASIEVIANPSGINRTIRYRLAFSKAGALLKIVDERIENEKPDTGHEVPYLCFDYKYQLVPFQAAVDACTSAIMSYYNRPSNELRGGRSCQATGGNRPRSSSRRSPPRTTKRS